MNFSTWVSKLRLHITLRVAYWCREVFQILFSHINRKKKNGRKGRGGGRGGRQRDGGGYFSSLALNGAASKHLPSSTMKSPCGVAPHGSEMVSAEPPFLQFIAQCTDSQAPRRKTVPRCCCPAAVARCPHHCPAPGHCWLGCHWCCCSVFEFHCLCCIQGWIRQPEKT